MTNFEDEQISARFHAALEPITQPLGPALTTESIVQPPASVRRSPVASKRPRQRPIRARRSTRSAFVAAALTVTVGGVLAVHQTLATSPMVSHSSKAVVYTAAMVEQMAATTGAAVADSGMAQVNFSNTLADAQGSLQVARGASVFTFSGSALSSESQFTIVPDRQDGSAAFNSDTLRVVAGREYGLYKGGWYLLPGDDIGPASPTGLLQPDTDPRLFLQTLSPDAGFQIVGRESIGGVELTHLRATNPNLAVPFQFHSTLQWESDGKEVTTRFVEDWIMRVPALNVWVDSGGVVHRMDLTASISTNSVTTVPVSLPTNIGETVTQVLSLTFSHFGEREIITAPSHASATLPSCGFACIDNFYSSGRLDRNCRRRHSYLGWAGWRSRPSVWHSAASSRRSALRSNSASTRCLAACRSSSLGVPTDLGRAV